MNSGAKVKVIEAVLLLKITSQRVNFELKDTIIDSIFAAFNTKANIKQVLASPRQLDSAG